VSNLDRVRRRTVGWLAALVVGGLYGSLALSVDLRTVGLQSDEATYYLMAHSLAADGDLEYREADLVRAYRDFETGPSGVFLKRGTDVRGIRPSVVPPFIAVVGSPDPVAERLYFGKSFAYPLFAAPFVALFGTTGFLLFNALLLATAFLAVYLFTSARSGVTIGLLWASTFVFASVVPVYAVWMAPELFNWSLGVVAFFLWLYKYVAQHEPSPRAAWLRRPWTDAVAAALLGLLTFSKVTNALLLLPMLGWLLWTRAWRQAAIVSVAFAASTALWFGANIAVSGDWNYQGGGERATCYGSYPFQTPGADLEVCDERGRTDALTGQIFDPKVFWTNLGHNLVYFVVGRNSGLVAYFFPTLFAAGALVLGRRRRESWQWFVLGGVVLQALLFIVSQPYTYFGGGGTVGNRYFMGGYGPVAFLLPMLGSASWLAMPWLVGCLFMAKLVISPIQTTVQPGLHAKSGPFRWLPVELTNVNDLPLNNEIDRVRIWYGDSGNGDPGFQLYYLDDNTYSQEADGLSFWTRGESRAELLFKTDHLRYRSVEFTLTAGAVPTDVTVRFGGRRRAVSLQARQSALIQLPLEGGFPYKKHGLPSWTWVLEVSSSAGFVPAVSEGSHDTRFLGVRVRPIIVP